MLLFSTRLKVNDKLTADAFVQLIIEWNNTSKYAENIIPGLEWNGERQINVQHDNLKLDIIELADKNIIAARYEKRTEDGTVWNTDYVLNLAEKKICIRLDRTYMENALISDQGFSTPHFISMLITKGYLDSDNGMAVLRTPVSFGMDSIDLFKSVIYGGQPYSLPIVYVSRTMTNRLPVDARDLAQRLKGVAHVIVAENSAVCNLIKNGGKKAENGGDIGIYFLNDIRRHKTYKLKDFRGYTEGLLSHVVNYIIRQGNIREIDPLYTWNGVNRDLLLERINTLHNERKAFEEEKNKDKLDNEDLFAMYEEEISALQEQINSLSKLNTSLELENHGLRSKISEKESLPLLYFGKESDLYPGEVKDLVLRTLTEARKGIKSGTRRANVVDDIVDSNEYEAESERLEKMTKTLLNGYKTMSGSTRQGIKELGFDISEDGSHYKLTYRGDNRYMTVLSKTGSDHREGKNVAQEIIKMIY